MIKHSCTNASVLVHVIIGCLISLASVCLTFSIYFVPGYKNRHVCERNKETLHRWGCCQLGKDSYQKLEEAFR